MGIQKKVHGSIFECVSMQTIDDPDLGEITQLRIWSRCVICGEPYTFYTNEEGWFNQPDILPTACGEHYPKKFRPDDIFIVKPDTD